MQQTTKIQFQLVRRRLLVVQQALGLEIKIDASIRGELANCRSSRKVVSESAKTEIISKTVFQGIVMKNMISQNVNFDRI